MRYGLQKLFGPGIVGATSDHSYMYLDLPSNMVYHSVSILFFFSFFPSVLVYLLHAAHKIYDYANGRDLVKSVEFCPGYKRSSIYCLFVQWSNVKLIFLFFMLFWILFKLWKIVSWRSLEKSSFDDRKLEDSSAICWIFDVVALSLEDIIKHIPL